MADSSGISEMDPNPVLASKGDNHCHPTNYACHLSLRRAVERQELEKEVGGVSFNSNVLAGIHIQ